MMSKQHARHTEEVDVMATNTTMWSKQPTWSGGHTAYVDAMVTNAIRGNVVSSHTLSILKTKASFPYRNNKHATGSQWLIYPGCHGYGKTSSTQSRDKQAINRSPSATPPNTTLELTNPMFLTLGAHAAARDTVAGRLVVCTCTVRVTVHQSFVFLSVIPHMHVNL